MGLQLVYLSWNYLSKSCGTLETSIMQEQKAQCMQQILQCDRAGKISYNSREETSRKEGLQTARGKKQRGKSLLRYTQGSKEFEWGGQTPPGATGPTTAHPEGAEPETERSSKPLACCPQGRALPPAWWVSGSGRAAAAKQAPPTHQDKSLNLKDKSISASVKKTAISIVIMIIDEKIFFFLINPYRNETKSPFPCRKTDRILPILVSRVCVTFMHSCNPSNFMFSYLQSFLQ